MYFIAHFAFASFLSFCRPGADDVVVLKKELVSVQMLMDQMSLEAEAEKEKLKEQLSKMQDDYDR